MGQAPAPQSLLAYSRKAVYIVCDRKSLKPAAKQSKWIFCIF